MQIKQEVKRSFLIYFFLLATVYVADFKYAGIVDTPLKRVCLKIR